MLAGKICYLEIPTADVETSANFCAKSSAGKSAFVAMVNARSTTRREL